MGGRWWIGRKVGRGNIGAMVLGYSKTWEEPGDHLLGRKLLTLYLTKFSHTQWNPLPRKLRQHTNERLQKKPRKANDGVSTPDLTTQLQLAMLIADMTMTSNLKTLLMMFHQNTWRSWRTPSTLHTLQWQQSRLNKEWKWQSGNDLWIVGGILKVKKTTKRARKVQEILYSRFKGNQATL